MTQQIKVIAVVAIMVVSSFGSSISSMNAKIERYEAKIERHTDNFESGKGFYYMMSTDSERILERKVSRYESKIVSIQEDIQTEIDAINSYNNN